MALTREELAKEMTVALLSRLEGATLTPFTQSAAGLGKAAGEIFAAAYKGINDAIDNPGRK